MKGFGDMAVVDAETGVTLEEDVAVVDAVVVVVVVVVAAS